jgi:hypothetical protein
MTYGQTIHLQPATTFPRFKVAEGQMDENGFPTSGAKLCLADEKNVCYQMPSHTLQGSNQLTYDFGLEPHARILSLTNGGSWVFFSAMFSAGGSGTLTRLAILRYQPDDHGGALINLLPYDGVTDESEHAIWTVPSVSSHPILVHADFIWGSGEIHFGPHYYQVEAWRFDTATGRYTKAVSYRTSKKYDGGDSVPISVLGPERAEILSRLSTQ